MRTPEPIVLARGDLRLEPLARTHAPQLLAAAADPVIWRWMPAVQPQTISAVEHLVDQAIADPDRLAWAVVVGGRAVGTTSYLDLQVELGGLEIGWTWYAPDLWRTQVNPTCKLLLLGHAFDDLGARRVLLKTDALNTRSRSAITRLGAAYDGTLRHHRLRPDGSVRDTAYFSVLSTEWPAVRAGLEARLT